MYFNTDQICCVPRDSSPRDASGKTSEEWFTCCTVSRRTLRDLCAGRRRPCRMAWDQVEVYRECMWKHQHEPRLWRTSSDKPSVEAEFHTRVSAATAARGAAALTDASRVEVHVAEKRSLEPSTLAPQTSGSKRWSRMVRSILCRDILQETGLVSPEAKHALSHHTLLVQIRLEMRQGHCEEV